MPWSEARRAVWHTHTMREELFDLAVVGAGPAGAVTAYAAARRGLRVALIDRYKFPRDKVCGDGVGPGVVRVAQKLGFDDIFHGDIPISTVMVIGPDGVELESAVPSVDGQKFRGYVVPRLELDERVFKRALKEGAEDYSGMKFMGTKLLPDARNVVLRDEDGELHGLHTRLLVGADGAHSVVRKALGVPPNTPRHVGIAMRAYARSDSFDQGSVFGPRLLLEFSRELLPSYGWVFPTGKGTVNIGVGCPMQILQRRGINLRNTVDGFVALMRSRGIDIEDVHGQRAHHLPHVGAMPQLVHPRAALIGDAASMINPLSGEGMSYAMTAASQLIDALPDSMASASAEAIAGSLAEFERAFRARYRLHFASSLAAQRLMHYPGWAKMVVRAAQRDPAMLRDAIELLFGFGRIRATTSLRILRYGWR
jgi:geranylgeranyl reductase family protein